MVFGADGVAIGTEFEAAGPNVSGTVFAAAWGCVPTPAVVAAAMSGSAGGAVVVGAGMAAEIMFGKFATSECTTRVRSRI